MTNCSCCSRNRSIFRCWNSVCALSVAIRDSTALISVSLVKRGNPARSLLVCSAVISLRVVVKASFACSSSISSVSLRSSISTSPWETVAAWSTATRATVASMGANTRDRSAGTSRPSAEIFNSAGTSTKAATIVAVIAKAAAIASMRRVRPASPSRESFRRVEPKGPA